MQKFTILLVLLTLIMAGCSSAESTETALTLINLDGSTFRTYTLADVKKLPAVEGYAGYKLTSGKIELPEKFTGVPLAAIGKLLPGFTDTTGLLLTSADGSKKIVTYQQLLEASVEQYGPLSGNLLGDPVPYTAILAYRQGNKALDQDRYGNLRLVFISEERNQVVDESWSFGDIASIQLVEVQTSNSGSTNYENLLPTLFGNVINSVLLTELGLEEFTLNNLKVEDDPVHQGEYSGIYIKDLLEYSRPLKIATAVQFTNAEGSIAQILLGELIACQTCMLAINPDGTLNLVMPGLPDAMWLENVKLIEIR